jgi:hypothetical protein
MVIRARHLAPLIVSAAAMAAGGPVRGQAEPFTFTPVDEGVGDFNPLATSLRVIDAGLAVASGFEQVYRVPGRDDRFMRVQGGVYAVFPNSVYSRTSTKASVPPGTTFYIGSPAFQFIELELARQARGTVDHGVAAGEPSIDVTSPARRAAAPLVEPPPPRLRYGISTEGARARDDLAVALGDAKPERGPAIIADAVYREHRLHSLLERAARAITAPAARSPR